MEKYIVDRFEEDFAVLEKENGGTTDVLASLIPDCKEGDVVVLENGIYRVDAELSDARMAAIEEKMHRLFGKK